MSEMSKILECKNLSKQFKNLRALDDVNLEIKTGKIVGLLGPNGSGKTTLIKLANGLIKPTSGEVLIDGKPPGLDSKKIVSYLPDKTYFDEWMSVKNCVSLFADFYEDFDQKIAEEMLAKLEIKENLSFRKLSKGTKEKVQLVLVMSRKAKLYLLDEPIGGVDPAVRDYILDTIIKNYNKEGSVIINTHLIADIEPALDDVIFIKEGKIEKFQSVDDMREETGKSVDEVFREVYNVR